tara:strand:- start:414 stop:560 length:147 start_codon:yes stop_codon:yes gene_type:complete
MLEPLNQTVLERNTMKNAILKFLDDDLFVAGTALGLFGLSYFIEAVSR